MGRKILGSLLGSGCFAVMAMAVSGCSFLQDGFTSAESELINGGDKTVMRVLKSDVQDDQAVLRVSSKELSDRMIAAEEYGLLCRRMLMTVQDPENDGVGIAAPQVGISRRLIAVQRFDKEGEPFEFFANPYIVRYGDETVPGGEGCLSVPGLRGTVERAQEVDVRYRTLHGTDTIETVSGFTAVIFQHEIDHLDGILYPDRAAAIGNDFWETRTLEDGSRITWIQDNAEPRKMPASLFPDAGASLIGNLGLQDGIPSSVSVFLLEKDGIRILFDAGNGTRDSRMPAAFESLGITHDDIDYIFITHLHGDHIGGLMAGEEPAFHSAKVYIAQEEFDGWMNMPSDRNVQQRQLYSAYDGRVHLFRTGDDLPGKVEAIAAHGHTPGHTVYRSGNVLVVGDILHGAALQMQNPEICAAFDMDKKAAVASRRNILKYASDRELVMAGMHFPGPAFK